MVSRKKAFTLVELLAVIAIIGILAGFIFAAVSSSIQRAKIHTTKVTITSLATALTNYERDMGSFGAKLANGEQMPTGLLQNPDDLKRPSNESKLLVRLLTGKTSTGSIDKGIREDPNWDGPYYDPKAKGLKEGALADAWGSILVVRIKEENYDEKLQHNPDSFEIYSAGPNEVSDDGRSSGPGKQGGLADDINNWE